MDVTTIIIIIIIIIDYRLVLNGVLRFLHHCSLWGKFAQRDNMKKVKYLTDPADFFNLLSNDGVEVKTIDSVSDQMVRVEYTNAAYFVEEQANVNVAIAAYTTAYGRLELYSYLERLGERVLYFDTGQHMS